MVKYLQCGVFPRAQGHVEGSSDMVECTRNKHLHIQAADKKQNEFKNRKPTSDNILYNQINTFKTSIKCIYSILLSPSEIGKLTVQHNKHRKLYYCCVKWWIKWQQLTSINRRNPSLLLISCAR